MRRTCSAGHMSRMDPDGRVARRSFTPRHSPLTRGSPDKIKSKKRPSLVGCYPGHPTGPREILLREARRSEIR